MSDLLRELRQAARGLRRSAAFTATTVLTLGLGLGVVAALFAVVDAALLQPIVADQDRVVRVWKHDVGRGLSRHPLSYPEFLACREASRSFESLAAINYADSSSAAVAIDGQPSAVEVTAVSSGFFGVVHRGAPLHGRWLSASDELPGAAQAAVVSEGFWRRVASGDPSFVGKRLPWAGGQRTLVVVGVAPAALDYPLGTDLWVPIAGFYGTGSDRFSIENRGFAQFELIGRLAPGALPEQARAELAVVHRRLVTEFPDDYWEMRVVVQPLLHSVLGDARQVLLFLFAAAGLVFVIAGVNVSALLLMRAAARRREQAVRVALGASRARLAREALSESLLLGALGAGCGLLFAWTLLAGLAAFAPGEIPRLERAALDPRVLAFCALAALAWVLSLGSAPSWRRRLDPAALSPELGVRGVRGTAPLRLFTIVEIAAAVAVAVAAGVLLRSFARLQAVDRGFETGDLTVVSLLLSEAHHPDARTTLAFYERLVPEIAALPGVVSVTPFHVDPGSGTAGLSARLKFEGQTDEEARRNPWTNWDPVMPGYFETLGIPITRGRSFTPADGPDAAPVAIVNEALARHYWPGQDPLGQRLQVTSDSPWATVVGVAGDLRYRELRRTWLGVYMPAGQFFFFSPRRLAVRSATPAAPLLPAIRARLQALDPSAAIESIASMEALTAKELARPRAAMAVASLFALLAVLLAAVGVYGVLSYEVGQRRRELALRSALGASPARIFRAELRRGLMLGGVGAAFGLATAALATRSLRALLFEIAPTDPRTYALAAAILLGIVLAAACLPARRAAHTDPAVVLRNE
jgi:putative ABC transport system permease protein